MRIVLILIFLPLWSLAQDNVQSEVLELLNAERKKRSRAPLEYTTKYQDECDSWARYLAKNFHHNYSNYYRGEVICVVPAIPELIILTFMESPEHKKVLMDRKAERVCIGIHEMPADTVKKNNGVEINLRRFYTVIRTY